MALTTNHLRTAIRRVAPIAVIAALAASVATSPAAASSGPYCTSNGVSGCASFKSEGDHFYVCDYREDNRSVAVRYVYFDRHGTQRTGYAVNYWGPHRYNGCRDVVANHTEGSVLGYHVCLANHAHPGGKKMKIVGGTCGRDVFDRF
jgi:hypothetical protein